MGVYFVSVNYWAVLASAIISMIIGSLWYGPLFGKQWMNLMGFGRKDINKAKSKGMAKSYLLAIIAALIVGFVLAHIIAYVNATTFTEGLGTGVWMWLGFVATVSLGSILWEGKPASLYWINSLYWLVNLAIMGGILAVFQ
ncbi:DUF1761 domain-containing protein [Candidatus Pacearchaeota archaeon]|nr:DUF1761 domain-containing protein [Candidatus Pacearchaeota archaeon]OIO44021.1 MAG: hypothetical protein AUJ64_00965 [Candidatus Pacearchaeota archaeon CG1_02_39_14]